MVLKQSFFTPSNIKYYFNLWKNVQRYKIQSTLVKNYSNCVSVNRKIFFPHQIRKNFNSHPRLFVQNNSPLIKLNLPCDQDKLIKHIERLKTENNEIANNLTDKTKMLRNSFLNPVLELWDEIQKQSDDISQLRNMIADLKPESDKELLNEANHDLIKQIDTLGKLYSELIDIIIPPDEIDDMDIIVELTAGVGGQEAMLFTQSIFDMYSNFSQFKGWTCETIEYDTTDIGGLRHATLNIHGQLACKFLKHESGVHRVQRVPKTEKSGRIHTSTMTVAVLPQPSEIQVLLDPKDLKVETMRASGAGGQHVNKTESAVRVTHLPSGFVTTCQVTRSQHKNLEHAKNKLRALIYEKQRMEEFTKQTSNRKEQVGTAGRSEKVRTYNYAQDRISDHRLSKNYYNMEEFMLGNLLLNKLIEELMSTTRLKLLNKILDS